jgi:hypothetical protein
MTGRWIDPWSFGRLRVVRVDIPSLDGAAGPNAPTGGNFFDYDYYCPHCDAFVGALGAGRHDHCPKCNASPEHQTVENYSPISRDGDVVCLMCRTRVRGYDAG